MKNLRLLFLPTAFLGLFIFSSCESEQGPQPVDCTTSDLVINVVSVTDASGCTTSDGAVTLSAAGGTGPYEFKLHDASFLEVRPLQPSGTFDALQSGSYLATVVDDNGCEVAIEFQILQGTSSLAFNSTSSTSSGCETSNATITVDATGDGNLQFKLNEGNFTTNNIFENVAAGEHTVTITDDSGCTATKQVKVHSGVSYDTQVKPILINNCAISGCHDGSNGASRNWTVFSNVQDKAENIKTRTSNGTMPPEGNGTLTQEQIDLIACWVDDGALNN
ncbi:MAG: hypothetical protein ACNS60_18775 [Candidatus Cyclobacteriaceae bacterium M2_1C_046]